MIICHLCKNVCSLQFDRKKCLVQDILDQNSGHIFFPNSVATFSIILK